MTTPPDLMYAILAMAAYDEGQGKEPVGIGGVSTIGDATVISQGWDSSSGFEAVAFNWEGQTVISYRGTDEPILDGIADASLIVGNPNTPQVYDAVQFYQSVLQTPGVNASNVLLTGHSLGGGLAGLVAMLYGQPAELFDNISFGLR